MNKHILILIVIMSLSMLGSAFINNEPYTSEVKTDILYTTPISQTVLFTVVGDGYVEIFKNGYKLLNIGEGYDNSSEVFRLIGTSPWYNGSIIVNKTMGSGCRQSDGYCFNNRSIKRNNNLTTTYYNNDTYKFIAIGNNPKFCNNNNNVCDNSQIIIGTKEELTSNYGNNIIIKFEE